MIEDFRIFGRHLLRIFRLVRFMTLAVLLALALCALLLLAAEDLSWGEALYLTAITGLTIGYGDLAPKTTAGRAICVLIGLLGVAYIGIVVAVVNRALVATIAEKAIRASKQQGPEV